MAASILLTAGSYRGRRPVRCLHTSLSVNPTVELSFQKKGPEINGAEKTEGMRDWLDRRYQLTPSCEFVGTNKWRWDRSYRALLLMYYQPGEEIVYEGVRFEYESLIRLADWSVHSCNAHLQRRVDQKRVNM